MLNDSVEYSLSSVEGPQCPLVSVNFQENFKKVS